MHYDPPISFIQQLPKAELHIHLEGSIAPERVIALAQRNGLDLPFANAAALRAAMHYGDLDEFLAMFTLMCSTLNRSDDFADVVVDLARDARRQGIVYREVMFTYAYHQRRGVDLDTIAAGLALGRRIAYEKFGIPINFITNIDRTVPPSDARDFVDRLAQLNPDAGIVAIGMDSQEIDIPPTTHLPAFTRAQALGFRTTAHLGWDEGPEFVREALSELPLDRIDHGLRAVEDPQLLAQLAASRIPVTSCPLSSIHVNPTRYPGFDDHPFQKMWHAGVCVSLNSDDPAMIGPDLVTNYVEVARAYRFDADDLARLATNAFAASFAPQAARDAWIEQAARYRAA